MRPTAPEESLKPRCAKSWWHGGRIALLGILLAAITIVCYRPAGNLPFLLYEDPSTLSQNTMIQQGITPQSIAWAFKSTVTCNWQPLTSLSHMLAWQLWESDATKHHWINIFIHAADVFLLLIVFHRLTGSVWRSAFAAALFAWHPMHVESVAWISERKDVLGAFFFLLTIGVYGEYATIVCKRSVQATGDDLKRKSHLNRAAFWYLLSIFFFGLALMSKPNVVTLPFVLLLLDIWPLARIFPGNSSTPSLGRGTERSSASSRQFGVFSFKRLLLEKLPFFALCLADCVVTFLAQKASGALPSLDLVPMSLRFENALVSYIIYLKQFLWPADMGVFYLFPHSIPWWQVMGAAFLLASVTIFALCRFGKQPCLIVGWCWFLGTMVPMIGLVQMGMQSRADHHTYLPYIGLGIMVAWGVPSFWRNRSTAQEQQSKRASFLNFLTGQQGGLVLMAVAALIGLWLVTQMQLKQWQTSLALFEHTVQVSRANEAAHNMLGIALLNSSRAGEAASQFEETLKIQPYYTTTFRSRACSNLGLIELQQHHLDDAAGMFTEAIKLRPASPQAHFNLGAIYGQRGELDKAAEEFERLANMPPGTDVELNEPDFQTRVSRALIRCGRIDEALQHCHDLVATHPADPAFQSVLGNICLLLNRSGEAVQSFREAIHLAPKSPAYLNQLAGVLASSSDAGIRNGKEAIDLATRACDLTAHKNAAFLDTLSMAYAETGQFAQAITNAENARSIALANQDQRTADDAARKLDLYHAGMPYHEPPMRN